MTKKNKNSFPIFVSIPHSGVKIPPEADWLKEISPSVWMCDVDAFVDDLYRPALREFHIPSVFFEWHRYSVDVNRFSTEISDKTVEKAKQPLLKGANKVSRNMVVNQRRRKSLSDVHWHQTTKGDILIKKALSQKLHGNLIRKYFDPFHKKIKEQIKSYRKEGNKNVYLLDLHSMPSKGLAFHKDKGEGRKQVVIGDNEGRACSKIFRDLVIQAYQQAGFEVALNWPYKGGAITQHYGQPELGQHTLQVELNRTIYMDEKTKKKNSNYKQVQTQLKLAMAFIVKNYADII